MEARAEHIERVVEWVQQRQGTGDTVVGPDTDLLATGILDSMGLVALFFLIETMGGAPIDPSEATAAGAITPTTIVDRYL
jgi:acyl carrier protein